MSETVRLERVLPEGEDGPTTADVHPDEVRGFLEAGWAVSETIERTDAAETSEPAVKPKRTRRSKADAQSSDE